MQIPQLTFTRFLASIAIVMLHFGLNSFPWKNEAIHPLGDDLITAMSYFFILSGFILVISIANGRELPEKINNFHFWKRRAARLIPVYLFAVIMFFSLNYRINPDFPIEREITSYIKSIFLIQSWNWRTIFDVNYPAWSLSVEAFLYFIFPWLYFNIKNLKNKKLILISIISWIINSYVYYSLKNENIPDGFAKFFPPLHVATFLTGMCFGILFIRNYKYLYENFRKHIHIAALVITILILFFSHQNFSFMNYQHNGLLSPFYIIIIYSISLTTGTLKKILASKPLVFLGSISYSIYILQVPIHQLCERHLPYLNQLNRDELFYPYLIILLFCSSLVYILIEKPARNALAKR